MTGGSVRKASAGRTLRKALRFEVPKSEERFRRRRARRIEHWKLVEIVPNPNHRVTRTPRLPVIAGSTTAFGFDCPLIDSKGTSSPAWQAIGHPKLAWKQRRRLFWVVLDHLNEMEKCTYLGQLSHRF